MSLSVGCAPAKEDATAPTSPTASLPVVTLPTPAPTVSPFAEREAGDHAIGPGDAYLTILVYCDFQSPACAEVAHMLDVLRERFAGEGGVRTVWRHFPQADINDKAALALQASEAAAAQDAFWPMHDLLLARQDEWMEQMPEEFRITLSDYAESLGLDVAAFDADLDTGTYADIEERTRADAASFDLLGVSVPVLAFNGERYRGALEMWALDATTRAVLLEQRWYPHAPTMIIDLEAEYRATIITEKGDIVVSLFVDEAPVAVNNFVYLSRDGWYDNNTFFRVIDGAMAVAGDPTGTGLGGPGYTIIDEADNGLTFGEAGMVAMLRSRGKPNTAGSQFFITMGPMPPDYDGAYTIFGQVVAGMETVETLTLRDPVTDPLAPPGDRIEYILIEEFRPELDTDGE